MDDKLLERVRKLLNKAENEGCTDEESQSLTAKAAELMAKYGIDQALLDATAPKPSKPADKIVRIPNPWARVHATLLCGLAKAVGVESILLQTQVGDKVHLFGFDTDLERLELLYTSLLLQMANGVRRLNLPPYVTGKKLAAERRSYMLGFMAGAVLKVVAAEQAAKGTAVQENGAGTELVLADRSLAVRDALKTEYPKVRAVQVSYTGSQFERGQKDGRNANIGGTSVGRRTAGALR